MKQNWLSLHMTARIRLEIKGFKIFFPGILRFHCDKSKHNMLQTALHSEHFFFLLFPLVKSFVFTRYLLMMPCDSFIGIILFIFFYNTVAKSGILNFKMNLEVPSLIGYLILFLYLVFIYYSPALCSGWRCHRIYKLLQVAGLRWMKFTSISGLSRTTFVGLEWHASLTNLGLPWKPTNDFLKVQNQT